MLQLCRFLVLCTLLTSAACVDAEFVAQVEASFADQHFKSTIALIELHKVRFGEYPPSLDAIKFAGEWDRAAFASVKYQRLPRGYALDIVPFRNRPAELSYPPEFWEGLGLVRSNAKK